MIILINGGSARPRKSSPGALTGQDPKRATVIGTRFVRQGIGADHYPAQSHRRALRLPDGALFNPSGPASIGLGIPRRKGIEQLPGRSGQLKGESESRGAGVPARASQGVGAEEKGSQSYIAARAEGRQGAQFGA